MSQGRFQCTVPVGPSSLCGTLQTYSLPFIKGNWSSLYTQLCLPRLRNVSLKVFMYTSLYIMSKFKPVFAGQTTALYKLSLLTQCSSPASLYALTFVCIHYICSLVVMVCVFACSSCSICLPGSQHPCCYKQEQARTASLCPTARPERPKKSASEAHFNTRQRVAVFPQSLNTCGMP